MRQSICHHKSKNSHRTSDSICRHSSPDCGVPSASLEITAAPRTYSAPGDKITYTYTLTNTGSRCISSPVTVYDNLLGEFTIPFVKIPVGKSGSYLVNYKLSTDDFNKPNVTNLAYAVIRLDKCNVVHTNPAFSTVFRTKEGARAIVATISYNGSVTSFKVTGIPGGLTQQNISISPSQGNTISIDSSGDIVGTITGLPNSTIKITVPFVLDINVILSTSNNIVTITANGIPAFLIDIDSITLSGGTITSITTQNGSVTIVGSVPVVGNAFNAVLTVPFS